MILNDNYYRALDIINRIEEIREEKNITRTEFGKQMGLSQSYYYVVYDNCRIIRINTLVKIAKILNISIEYLFTGKNKQPFKDFKINYDKIINAKTIKMPNRLRVIKSNLKRNKTSNIMLKTIFDFERQLNISAIKLIGGK